VPRNSAVTHGECERSSHLWAARGKLESDSAPPVQPVKTATRSAARSFMPLAQPALLSLANTAAELDRFIGDAGPLLTVQDGVDVEV
jgi:hypothetical protein